ncbi:RNA polymerase, sigma subunit, ECF family [Muriicola jejuensis]|uniref:Sigma-70 family RNA polymerase sigma factor n=1 Tax=Muriicola jejuensis TaxID=504488 RepID=A0A6P0UH53_9FLAO|nr:sigma-70 family RNA polymerase sigma factor [Muriicola jejuensis]NER11169.1 sigma-70 family RNA polymerase sigma factor [Muriicola jejuensis]SMP24136.1 RNA polymerase, sigma subunit, ECF family [Muriicola jejuensis]
MHTTIDDATLIRNYINGDEKAIELLINKHNQRLSSYIYSKVKDMTVTEDIFQDTFIKVISTFKRGTYNEEGKFLPWVMRIAHNLIIDHFRRNKRMPKYQGNQEFNIFSVLTDDKPNAERQLIKDQIDQDLEVLIEQLPKDQLEVLKMRIYQNMSFNEIAENTEVSINTALGRMRYALINLRKLIEKNQIVLTN